MSKDDDIRAELRRERKFSLAAAIGEEGGGFFAGGTTVLPTEEVAHTVSVYLDSNLNDSMGVLRMVLVRRISDDIALLDANVHHPLGAIVHVVEYLLACDTRLYGFVRRVDAEYGRMMSERPIFQRPGAPEDPEDAYTHQSVRASLTQLLVVLRT